MKMTKQNLLWGLLFGKKENGRTPTLQAKTNISPTTSSQTISPDAGYDGLSSVQINAMPNGSVTAPASISGTGATVSAGTNTLTLSKSVSVTPSVTTPGYVSGGTAGTSSVSLSASVNTRSSSDLTASGATVTAPAGYYAAAASKSVSSMTLPSSADSSSSGTLKATIAASTSTRYLNIPAGYNSTAQHYKLSAISPTKSAQTYTPTTSDQTISSGRWLSGNQTIKGDANLVAGNIKKDVSIFGVTGTYEGGGGGGGKLYVFCGQGYNGDVGVAIASIIPTCRFSYYDSSLVAGSTVSITTGNDWTLDFVKGEESGTIYSFNTISSHNYTFTMPSESVYCELYYDD